MTLIGQQVAGGPCVSRRDLVLAQRENESGFRAKRDLSSALQAGIF
jgi:hypothetical protein